MPDVRFQFPFEKELRQLKKHIDSLMIRPIGVANGQIIVGDSMNSLNSMSVNKLTKLREQVNEVLGAKVAAERRTLEARLGELGRLTAGPGRKRNGGGARGAVAPKYRNPDNPAETWAGRGLRPRWLAAALKAGKKLEEFSIEAAGKKTRGAPRKARQKQPGG